MQQYIHGIVYRAFYLQHFRHYYYCCCNNCCCVVVLTLTHRYNAVRGHRTDSSNCCCCVLPPLFNMHGILWGSSLMKHKLAVLRSDKICYPYVRLFGFFERRVLVPQGVGRLAVLIRWGWIYEEQCTVGVWLFCHNDGEYMKNGVPWKRIHPAGPLDWCQRPHVHRKPRDRRKAVSPFLSTFWGGVPIFVIRPKNIFIEKASPWRIYRKT